MSPDNSTLPTIRLNTGALAYLQRIARTEGDTMSQVSLASLSFGILTILVVTSIYFLISRGSAAQTNGRILLLGTVLLYMSTASYMAALIWSWKNRNYFVERANDGLFRVSPLYDGAADAAALKHAVRQQSWLLTFALGTNFVIGDAIVWWWACVIWQHRVVTCIGPLLVIAAMSCSIIGMTTPQHVPNGFDLNIMYGSNALSPASLILSLTTNVLATSLIGYKTWRIIFVAYHADPPASNSGANYAFEVIANDFEYGCLVPLVAIYPTTIIAIVHSNSHQLITEAFRKPVMLPVMALGPRETRELPSVRCFSSTPRSMPPPSPETPRK